MRISYPLKIGPYDPFSLLLMSFKVSCISFSVHTVDEDLSHLPLNVYVIYL